MALQNLRSSTAHKRPVATSLSDGQIAINTNAASPGIFFKNSSNVLTKVGPIFIGTSAPNSSPAGSAGNAVGEQWLDTSGGAYALKIWDGSAWQQTTVSGLTDANIAAGAAIQGTKIDPDFGSQTVETTGVFSAAGGAAATPSITFTGDLNTGIYSPGADQVAISTNGTGRLFVDANGNVGVGTGSPLASAGFSGVTASGSSGGIFWFAKAGAQKGYIYGQDNDVTIASTDASGVIRLLTGGNTERLRITSDGKLGLGTSSVSGRLHVIADANTSGAGLQTWGYDVDQPNYQLRLRTDVSAGVVKYNFNLLNQGTEYDANLVLDRGNVGIGTTSPDNKLHVFAGDSSGSSSAQAQFTIENSGNSGLQFLAGTSSVSEIRFGDSGDNGAGSIAYSHSDNSIRFGTNNGTEKVRIDSSGRLLVGTSTTLEADKLLQVAATDSKAGASFIRYVNFASSAPSINLAKSRGTSVGADATVSNNDSLGYIQFKGNNGTDFLNAAWITCEVDGEPNTGGDTTDMPGRLVFSTTVNGSSTPTERMRINSNGGVNVGSGVLSSASGDGNIVVDNGIYIGTYNGDNQIRSSSAGAGSATLYIGNAAIQVSSDRRLKKDIEDTQLDALDAISKIKVKDFTWDDPTDNSYNNRNARGKWTGLIAQELVEVLPFVVNAPRKEEDGLINHDSEARWTLDQSQLCPVLIKAVQQQQEIIAGLEARLATLEAQ